MAVAISARKEGELTPEQVVLVRHHLKDVLTSRVFAGSKRAQDFLKLIVGHTLEGHIDSLRERMIGAEMFGRPVGYDTANDPVVRVKASEVRRKLALYYSESKGKQAVRIDFPSGTYVPRFYFEAIETDALPKIEIVPTDTREEPAPPNDEWHRGHLDSGMTLAPFFPSEKAHSPQRISTRTLVGATLGLAILAIAAYVALKTEYFSQNTITEIRSVAILPLENLSGDPGQEYFADGMTEELINDLGQVSSLRVISRTSAMSYKKTKKKLPEIARELGVDGVVEGTVQREDNQVKVSARLIDARTDHPIWEHTYVRDLTNVLALQGELSEAIAEGVSISLTPQTRLTRVRSVNTKAEDLYMRGMLSINAGDPRSAMGYFQAAISADPDFAQAHAALASCYGQLGETGFVPYSYAFLKQKTEALKAVEFDDTLPEGHAQLAEATMNMDWDWSAAAKEFSRALALNPSSAPIHEEYGMYLSRVGRHSEAIAETQRGVELDPVGSRSYWNAAFAYFCARQYDQALPRAQKAQELSGNSTGGSFILGQIYAEKGMFVKAISEFQKLGDSPHVLGHLGNAYARSGQAASAQKIILQLEQNVRKDEVGGFEIALIYAGLGEKNEAFNWLEESYKTHNYGLEHLKLEPCLDPLRSDARFYDLERRVGLTP